MMKVRVQSLHFLDDKCLVAIWRRSAFDEEYRDCLEKIAPPNESDNDEENNGAEKKKQTKQPVAKEWLVYWLRRNGKSDIGQLEIQGDNYCFWANWIETNRGLVPVLDPDVFGQPLGWRIIVFGEDGRVCAAGSPVSFGGHRYSLAFSDGQPMVVSEEMDEGEKKKTVNEARGRLNNLSARLRKLTRRFTKKEEE